MTKPTVGRANAEPRWVRMLLLSLGLAPLLELSVR